MDLTNGVTTVDCQKQVRSWRLLRSLIQLLIPTCNCTLVQDEDIKSENYMHPASAISGTIFGYRRGKVRLCMQANPESTSPILMLELPVATSILAKEMRGGTLRMVLESATPGRCNLLSTPLWSMHCNGRKMGYAVKRRPSNSDLEALRVMRSVVVGAGIINGEDHLMYLRAMFRRVGGSSNSESFHLIDPEGSIGQELSIFFFRSRVQFVVFGLNGAWISFLAIIIISYTNLPLLYLFNFIFPSYKYISQDAVDTRKH